MSVLIELPQAGISNNPIQLKETKTNKHSNPRIKFHSVPLNKINYKINYKDESSHRQTSQILDPMLTYAAYQASNYSSYIVL